MVNIRQEISEDYNSVARVNSEAFERDNESLLVQRLRNNETFIPELSLVADNGSELIGHILFTEINIVEGSISRTSLALAPMAVVPRYQNSGIGSELVVKGIERAAELGYESVIVLGHNNFYPKFGFKRASEYNVFAPFDVPDEYFMALELKEGALNGFSNGTVIYPQLFLELE